MISGKNTQLGSNKKVLPSGYSLKSIDIKNHRGEERDIQNIITKVTLTESLFSPTVIAKFSVKDSNNLIEELELIGQETISLKIEYGIAQDEKGAVKTMELKFFITEYPAYGRSQNQHTQVYTLIGISEQAYISSLKRISRGFSNNTASEIKQIFTSELNLPEEKFIQIGNAVSSIKGIINTQTPLKACEWLRRQTSDDNYAPYFLYQNIRGDVNLVALTDLYDSGSNPSYQTFYKTTGSHAEPTSVEDYVERATRLIDSTSELGLSKLMQAKEGAWASNNRYLDISRKTYTNTQYNYNSDYKRTVSLLPGNSALSPEFSVNSDKLNEMPDAHTEHISVNADAYDGVLLTYNNNNIKAKHFQNAFNSLLNTATHDIEVFGDFNLNPGRKITLKFPKAVDPVVLAQAKDSSSIDLYDDLLSGDCIITSVIHRFENNEYYCNIRCKKDSITVPLTLPEKQKVTT